MKNISIKHFLPIFISFFISCAYFNTFYNAQDYFNKGEEKRLQKKNEMNLSDLKLYETALEKAKIVVEKYPDSKLRKRAIFIIGKSHYHRGEYNESILAFNNLKLEFGAAVENETNFWLALIKWKKGNNQPALIDLEKTITKSQNTELKSQALLASGEIYLELDSDSIALNYLEQAAELSEAGPEKGEIYFRISNIAYTAEEFNRALDAYNKVLKFSINPKYIQESHLKKVQIYRKLGDNKRVAELIKSLLLDIKYKSIFDDLEIELVHLYINQGKELEAELRLESIVNEYPKTISSAEAYYLLAEFALNRDWNLEKALKYYELCPQENYKSSFSALAQVKAKEIKSFQKSLKAIDEFDLENLKIQDSLTIADPPTLLKSIDQDLYNTAELYALHFNRPTEAIVYLDRILSDFPDSELIPKTLYTKIYLSSDSISQKNINIYRHKLINEHPLSEYTLAILKTEKIGSDTDELNQLLLKAESSWSSNDPAALNHYKTILEQDSLSPVGVRAAFFLAYNYDNIYHNADSAKKYYNWIIEHYPETEQGLEAQLRLTAILPVINNIK